MKQCESETCAKLVKQCESETCATPVTLKHVHVYQPETYTYVCHPEICTCLSSWNMHMSVILKHVKLKHVHKCVSLKYEYQSVSLKQANLRSASLKHAYCLPVCETKTVAQAYEPETCILLTSLWDQNRYTSLWLMSLKHAYCLPVCEKTFLFSQYFHPN